MASSNVNVKKVYLSVTKDFSNSYIVLFDTEEYIFFEWNNEKTINFKSILELIPDSLITAFTSENYFKEIYMNKSKQMIDLIKDFDYFDKSITRTVYIKYCRAFGIHAKILKEFLDFIDIVWSMLNFISETKFKKNKTIREHICIDNRLSINFLESFKQLSINRTAIAVLLIDNEIIVDNVDAKSSNALTNSELFSNCDVEDAEDLFLNFDVEDVESLNVSTKPDPFYSNWCAVTKKSITKSDPFYSNSIDATKKSNNVQSSAESKRDLEQNCKLFVGNLSYKTNEVALKNYFCKFGELLNVNVKHFSSTKHNHHSYGFVTYSSVDSAAKCINYGPHMLDDKHIEVDYSKSTSQKKNAVGPEIIRKLFVGNLNEMTTEKTLNTYFSKFGSLVDFFIMRYPDSKRSRCFGFITYSSEKEAKKCLKSGPHIIDENILVIDKPTPRQ